MIDEDNIHSDKFNLTADYGLKASERAIADLYRGGSKEFTNNKKRCYMVLHPRATERTAEKRASELFKRPAMVKYLEIKTEDVSFKADVNAAQLIKDSRRLMDYCFGDVAYTNTVINEDGNKTTETIQKFDANGVKGAIDLQGKLTGSFSEKTIHSVDKDMNFEIEFV